MRRLAILVIIAIASMSSMAAAQTRQDKPGACSHAPAIMAAADFLLAEPAQFPNFWRDRYGDDAAYLKIRYGDLSHAEGSALLANLEKRSHPPQRIAELRLAYAKTADRAAMIAGMQPQPNAKSILPQLGLPALRVLVIEDGGDWLLGELGHLQTLDLYQALDAAKAIADALSVLDDEAKSQFAQRAENAGVWPLALEMRAVKDDLSDYVAYLDKLPPHKGNRTGFIRNALYSADLRPSFDISKQPAEVQALDRQNGMGPAIRQIGRLIDYAPQAAILLPLVNQTGDLRLGTTVAAALNAQIAGKQLDPVNDPDAVTTAMLDGIDHVLGHRDREDNLRHALIFEMGETAESFIDRALARSTLASFMQGNVAKPPPRPKLLTAALPWEQWVGLAGRLKAGEAIAPEDRIVAADLMIAADRPADALALLKTTGDWKTAVRRSHELALRLDRRCADLLRPPMPISRPLYRFEPR
ncbi:hypothetical protein MesoLj113a_10910 [Mesorhizobium sp. 113-1-2]|uniref:hypothetical protein n=1 Tax=Mesorhizobium sp. 113-1-2 TaxID=2744515 RepID=UPI001928460C|nr:hypothetical protein [Mesorhizobium sp. 113-1-2]BCG69933.1 hypothetical protein MesoLj113a_10910 [Mesorhizobium sp. 113-1-2]